MDRVTLYNVKIFDSESLEIECIMFLCLTQ